MRFAQGRFGKKRSLRPATRGTVDRIREELLEKSQDLGLAVNPKDIVVVSARKEAEIPVAGLPAIVANDNQNELPSVGRVEIDLSYRLSFHFLFPRGT